MRRFRQPLMFIVTVLVAISFSLFYSHSDFMDQGSANRVGTIYGKNYSQAKFLKESRKFELCQYLFPEMLDTLAGRVFTMDDAVRNFVWNSEVLRHEAESLGIQPSEAEMETAIKGIILFQTNGVYDSNKFNMFSQNMLQSRGLTVDAVEDLARNDIRAKKLKAILATTLASSPAEVRATFEQRHRKLECSVIRFDFAEFLKAQNPTDEEVKKAYDERKTTLKTDELRKVKYVSFTIPPSDKPLVGKPRVDAFSAAAEKAQEFMVAMTEKDAKFDDVAKKLGATVKETPAFAVGDAPTELEKSEKAAEAAFALTKDQPNSDAVQTDKGYFLLQLADITPAREKTFEEAKTALVDTLKNERAQEAMTLKATEVRNKLEADLKAGKSFADAATAAGVKAEPYTPFSLAEPPMKEKDGRDVTMATRDLNEGQISPFTPSSDPATNGGGLLVYVAKKQPADEKQFAESKDAITNELTNRGEQAIFSEWFKARRAAANIIETHPPKAES
jgi:peptidyl-prolyl cis-trans isomerase D